MDHIRYIHAADLHLDTPFLGIAHANVEMASRLRAAAFTALNRLTQLCLAQKPDFLLLAGDLYNDDEQSVKAQLKLRESCAALEKANINVYVVHGNHDPLSSRLSSIDWPANTFFFPAEPQKLIVEKNGDKLAMIHGASHATGREVRNIARLFKRDPQFTGFQIGLLHCNVDGAVKSDRYAPCSLSDLIDSGLDAWALGHAHTKRILSELPFIAYSGNTQGLHPNETGNRGCYLVTARQKDDGWHCEATFHALGPIIWEKASIDLNGVNTLDEVESRIESALEIANDSQPEAEAIILSATLTGRTILNSQLIAPEALEELAGIAKAPEGRQIWLRNLDNDTAPLIDETDNLERDDLLGEVSRVAQQLETAPERLQDITRTAFQNLARAARGILAEPGPEEQKELLRKARRICQDMLEDR